MRQDDKIVRSISDFVNYLAEDTKDIKAPIWYRGHAIKDWELSPLLIRKKFDSEMNLLKKFKQDATLFLNPRPTAQYEWLFIMRHYGVPTRLLDWSENPLAGLYFTINEHPNDDGALWVLLPLELNKEGNRVLEDPEHLPSFEEDEFMQSYSPEKYNQEKMTEMLPIAFMAPRNTSRMQAQLSVFTIHHRQKISIEEVGIKKHIWRYCIPKDSKERIKNELGLLGITKFQLFPELQSIGEIIGGKQ
ncbi:MAG: FRG domain-containing protein [Candidatus Omnitrophica bacterium]|nr:FRG domain-containing protein [Candidatus Omnitrophota bacterium]MDD5351814.1 FRG domain-containing protein [Candidatus Omnitrophota bacterium]MDD5550640.1 FRG domain-containing protein [Candidatus Omnitrophota bacterium]